MDDDFLNEIEFPRRADKLVPTPQQRARQATINMMHSWDSFYDNLRKPGMTDEEHEEAFLKAFNGPPKSLEEHIARELGAPTFNEDGTFNDRLGDGGSFWDWRIVSTMPTMAERLAEIGMQWLGEPLTPERYVEMVEAENAEDMKKEIDR